ncbi:Peptidyl-prolyl cis-trans isomerase fpr2 [Sporothrix curviconia]|uniref:Peptidyl-prolyl cis-trans isomerase fpr2 n=1 Tax=Sporothrix curviconia TaxID=1260050 RepID=A0ABP0CUW8_9PEZI
MHGLFVSLTLLASAATGALAADLKIDVTLPVECDRRTKAGDKIDVHYRGTLQSNGAKFDAIFETELLGIQGVPKPESIVTKSATDTPADTESSTVAETESANIAEKVVSKVAEAADAVKTIVADTDDSQEHNEL